MAGFHVYVSSQILSASDLAENFRQIAEISFRLSELYKFPLKRINFGGGFGVPYFSGQNEIGFAPLTKFLDTWLKQNSSRLAGVRLLVESGRYLVGDSGFYLTKVLYTKESRGKSFVVTDGGINHHLAATGIGQVIKKNFPIFNLSQLDHEAVSEFTIAGPTCYISDILGREVSLPKTRPGDLLCFGFSGAYGPSFSPVHFLSHPLPLEIFIKAEE